MVGYGPTKEGYRLSLDYVDLLPSAFASSALVAVPVVPVVVDAYEVVGLMVVSMGKLVAISTVDLVEGR